LDPRERLVFLLNKRRKRRSTIREEGFYLPKDKFELLKRRLVENVSEILGIDEKKIDLSFHEEEGNLIVIISIVKE